MFEVKSLEPGGAAQQCGIEPGDIIVSVNGEALIDYIDYVYFCTLERLKLRIMRAGKAMTLRMIKAADDDLGISFTQPLLGKKRICGNRCVFCFVEQLPKGMRKSLYLKDEDWRYSLIMGNYVTLADVGRQELKRIFRRKASPLYISVHTVDEKLRRRMLGNQEALPVRPILKKMAARGMHFHAQAVICPDFNDGAYMEETFRFLRGLYPAAMSLALVPVGLTGFRQGLTPISPVSAEMARSTIIEVEKWQKECLNSIGTRFVFAADEYYLRAGVPVPDAQAYEDFCQIENGVGLVAQFMAEAEESLAECKPGAVNRHVSIATGQDALPFVKSVAQRAAQICGAQASVYGVDNHTFGGGVSVAGLLGGRDFIKALKDQSLGDVLLIPAASLRDDNIFLDDMTLDALSEALGLPVVPVSGAEEMIAYIIGKKV